MKNYDGLPDDAAKMLRLIYALEKASDGEWGPAEAFAAVEGGEDGFAEWLPRAESVLAVLVERGYVNAPSVNAPSTEDTAESEQVAATLAKLVQDGDARVTGIGEDGEPRFRLEAQGMTRAEEVVAQSFGVPVDDFRAAPETVRKRIVTLVVGSMASE